MRTYKTEGWYKKDGPIQNNEGENLFSYISQSLFAGKHTTTYKYCLLKSILDNLYCLDDNYSISFEKIGETFVSIYWNMIAVYRIPQMPNYSTGSRSAFEIIIESILQKKNYLSGVFYSSLSEGDKKLFLSKSIPEFSKNVIGAFYNDTLGKIYGFSKASKQIWLNKYSFSFLCENRMIIEQVNYYQWLKMSESILRDNGEHINNLSTILECITKRYDLTPFKTKLFNLGEDKVCFYCGANLRTTPHLDHVIPWAFLKRDELWNFVFCCQSCNSSKSDKIPDNSYIEQLIYRNKSKNIDSPDIKLIVESAKMNGVKSGWRPSKK